MFIDSLAYDFKATVMAELIAGFNTQLPSYRETAIQAEKFTRMAHEFSTKFPLEFMQMVIPDTKFNKRRGVYKRRLEQQSKRLDALVRSVLEEQVMTINNLPGPKLKKRQIRGPVKIYVETLNQNIHKALQKRLQTTYAAAAVALALDKRP